MIRLQNNIDNNKITNGIPTHKINWAKYNSKEQRWHSLQKIFQKKDFIDLIFIKLTGNNPTKKEKNLLLKTLLLTSMGVGHHPPSIMIPKLISSTTKNKSFAIMNGISAGILSFGTDHLGAITGIMKTFNELKEKKTKNEIIKYIQKKIQKKEKIKGFGHPIYKKDSRPIILYNEIKKTYKKNKYIELFEIISEELNKSKGINPNIDAALALSYCSMGFEPEQGIYLSIISRSLSMTCHILEEFPEKPFNFTNKILPQHSFKEY